MPTKKLCNLKVKPNNTLTPQQSWIYLDGDPLLRQKSTEVEELTDLDLKIINQMVSYIDASYLDLGDKLHIRPGVAIAAPQMGLLKKIIYIHFVEGDVEHKYLLANPRIVSKSQVCSYLSSGEGCLSVPVDQKGYIPRNYKVIVEATDLLTGNPISISAVELLSICLQHEIDHLDGILYTDHINHDAPMHLDAKWLPIG